MKSIFLQKCVPTKFCVQKCYFPFKISIVVVNFVACLLQPEAVALEFPFLVEGKEHINELAGIAWGKAWSKKGDVKLFDDH